LFSSRIAIITDQRTCVLAVTSTYLDYTPAINTNTITTSHPAASQFITMAQAPAQPPATQAPDPTLWQCHICKDQGPITYALQNRCATCTHEVCTLCKKDDDIPSPLGAAPARVRSSPSTRGMQGQESDTWSTSQPPRRGLPDTRAHARTDHKLTSRPNRPPMRGWWRCSECRNVNNPALTDRRCTSCNHIKCPSCTAIRNSD
jgi:hypothetical protein